MFGIPLGTLGVADGSSTRPTNTPEDMTALQKMYATIRAQNHTPNGRVARGFDQFGPQASPAQAANVPALGGLGLFPGASQPSESPLQTAVSTPAPLPGNAPSPPALSAQALAQTPNATGVTAPPVPAPPMPMARPDEAPQAPQDMGFFARNAAMMQDPTSGAFLDPVNAERAQASGPDVINKLLSYFHNKDNS